METVSLSFPDSTYSSANKPSSITLKTDLSSIETALNANAASMTENTDTDLSSNSWFLDEDDLSSNSSKKVASQQSIKAYVGTAIQPSGDNASQLKVLRQDNTVNTYKSDTIFMSLWGAKQGDDSNPGTMDETVTFGVTFDSAPVIVPGVLGRTSSASNPSAIIGFESNPGAVTIMARNITTTGCTIEMARPDGIFSSSYFYGYSCLVIGEKA